MNQVYSRTTATATTAAATTSTTICRVSRMEVPALGRLICNRKEKETRNNKTSAVELGILHK